MLKKVDVHEDEQVVEPVIYIVGEEQLETHALPCIRRPLGHVFEQLYVAGEVVS